MDILKGKNAILKLRTQKMYFNFRLDIAVRERVS